MHRLAGEEAKEIRDSYPGTAYFDPRFHWTELRRACAGCSPTTTRRNARPCANTNRRGFGVAVLRINGQMANRGAPTDYNEWEARGATGWNWDAVPYFKKVEHDLDFDGPFHGKDGRIKVRRIKPEKWNNHAKAAARSFAAAGFKALEDQNGFFEDGYSRSPFGTLRNSASPPPWAIWTAKRASGKT
jgi:5-(hydroxymethyl)furfural/furfural oxidase